MLRKTFVYLIIVFCLQSVQSQEIYTERFYEYFVSGRMDLWEKELDGLKQEYTISKSLITLQQIVKAQYGLIGYYVGIEEKRKAAGELEIAHKNVDLLLEKLPNEKYLLAYKGALFGFEMGIAPWKVLYYGPKSQEYILKAIALAETDPESNFEYANMRFWAPAMFGGNKDEALIYYKKTINLIEEKNQIQDWYYLWVLTAYANALKEIGGKEAARPAYAKLLQIEPRYKWIKEELQEFPDFDL